MRILLNDFGGYPFPIELSRQLAHQGYTVMHCYLSNIKTPHGNITKTAADSDKFLIEPILLKQEFQKYSPIGRYVGEIEYAKHVAEKIDLFKPDIFLSANTPLLAQNKLLKKCQQKDVKFIYWCQDIHSIALEKFFSKKLPFVGKYFHSYFKRSEINLLKKSDHIINIAESFNAIFKNWGVSEGKMTVIHNWGPFSEIELLDKNNNWSRSNGIADKTVVLYTGTLGLKHNPMLIVESAKFFSANTDVIFVIISEGLGGNLLKEQKELLDLKNLIVLPYQDYEILSQVLSSADVLISILEEDAGVFSVPSKVLTYLCSGKSILLSVPKDNLSSKIIINNCAGFSTEPSNYGDFITKLSELINDPSLRKALGENGRKYAIENFSINLIAEKFIEVFNNVN